MLLNGCATTTSTSDFYGIKMDSQYASGDFIIKSCTENGVSFKLNSRTMDSRISAEGKVDFSRLNISITNDSNSPISTNFFGDSIMLITKDGTMYNLDKGDILNYPKGNYINPNTTAYYTFLLPRPIWNIKKEDVKKIIFELGVLLDKTTVVLKPLPNRLIAKANNKKVEEIGPYCRLLEEDIHDTPLKTQVQWYVALTKTLSKSELEQLLEDLSGKIKEKKNFQYNKTPTHIAIFVYHDEDTYKTNTVQWVGRFLKLRENESISINEKLLSFYNSDISKKARITDLNNKQIIGKWDNKHTGSIITIYKGDNTIYLEEVCYDNSRRTSEMVGKRKRGYNCYLYKDSGDYDDYYLINTKGDLETYDELGLITTSKKIR